MKTWWCRNTWNSSPPPTTSTAPARTKIVNDVLELTDLGYKRDALVDGLSRGMKQRLSIARVLVHDPKVLLLDEPAGNLDPRARIEMRELLKELQRRWAKPSSSPRTSCRNWPTCVTPSASSSRANCSTAARVADIVRKARSGTVAARRRRRQPGAGRRPAQPGSQRRQRRRQQRLHGGLPQRGQSPTSASSPSG